MGKIIKSYENFKNLEKTNEELLGLDKLVTGIKNLWKKGQDKIKNIKGGKEIEDIYQKYLTILQKEISNKAKINLNLAAASKGDTTVNTNPLTAAVSQITPKKESVSNKIFEAGEQQTVDPKVSVNTFKTQQALIKQIIDTNVIKMNAEFNRIIDKYKKDPQILSNLNSLIDIKKQDIKLAMVNAEMSYLQPFIDQVPEAKTMFTKLEQDSKKITTEVTKKIDELGTLKSTGMNYDSINKIYTSDNKKVIFLLPGKDMKLYDSKKKLSDQSEIVGVGEIKALNNQNNDTSVTINYEDKDIKMGYGKIIGQAPEENKTKGEGNTEVFKSYGVDKPEDLVGKEVYYKRDGFDDNSPSADLIGKNEVTAFDKEKGLTIKGKDDKTFEKGIEQLLSIEEGDKLTGNKSEEETKKPEEVLAELDDDTKKNVISYADFIQKPENKAKAERINKIITTNAG